MLGGRESRIRRWLFGRDLAVWYAPQFRLPLSAVRARLQQEGLAVSLAPGAPHGAIDKAPH